MTDDLAHSVAIDSMNFCRSVNGLLDAARTDEGKRLIRELGLLEMAQEFTEMLVSVSSEQLQAAE